LVEVDEMTGMSRHFTHLQTGEPVTDPRALDTVLLTEATNLGLAKMAQACPEYTYRQLALIADWYVRDETCRQGLTVHHQRPASTPIRRSLGRRHHVILGRSTVSGGWRSAVIG